MVSKTLKLIQRSLLHLIVIFVATRVSGEISCGRTGWYKGLLDMAAIDATVADYDSATGLAFLGGQTTDAAQFGVPNVASSTAAFILIVDESAIDTDYALKDYVYMVD